MDYTPQIPRWELAVVTLVTLVVGTAVALTPDGLALMEFRDALTVISPVLESWNASDASPCSWGGINCTDSGRVRNITLVAQEPRLKGSISSSLGKLEFLEGLVLDQNLLSGSIPSELGRLGSLRTLSLSFNRLTGGIPPELGNCSSLTELVLNFNWLSGNIPEVICKNLNLTSFDVSSNTLSGDITTVLDDLSRMPSIKVIGMDNNSFSGSVPPSIGNATTLVYLSLGQSTYFGQKSEFGGELPEELGNLKNLTTLSLGGLNLTLPGDTLPPWLVNLSKLSIIDFGQLNLKGDIPSWIVNMTSLTLLGLHVNDLNGTIPPSLNKLVNLNWLSLEDNALTGPIPSSIASMANLTTINLSNNSLSGQIPVDFAKTTLSLELMYLYRNNFSGPIPEDFGRFMPNFSDFEISNNFFNGTLPNGLCENGKLQILTASNNSFEGAIPSTLASCATLTVVGLQDNELTSIPDGFGRNSSLQIFWGARNRFAGQLPIGFGANSQLMLLDLSGNRFTGNISVLQFSDLAQTLSILKLAKNNFTGEIPIAMTTCKLLFHVDLSYNSLTGAVPLALGNLSNLQELYLQGNKLTMLHPSIYLGFAWSLQSLNLAENPWNTSIPTEIRFLTTLRTLNLSYGGYTGPIPSILGQLIQLEVLDLSYNNLTGELPSVLGELMTSLTSVNISFNRLTGSLPPAWVKFFLADPTSFRGNPGLCLQYNASNLCTEVSGRSEGIQAKVMLSMGVIVGTVVGGIALALLGFVAFYLWRYKVALPRDMADVEKEISEMNMSNESWLLTFEDIMSATENLSDKFIIGRGAHGVVYKVKGVSDAYPYIAVKKIVFTDTKPTLPHKSFWAEVKTVGKARHRNLVTLLGFIKRDKVGLLLYEYVSGGDLHSALHNTGARSNLHLNWEARLGIAKGVAHGLAYLHHDYDAPIVHRDIKSCNVLLDDDLEPHISDFGLAKVLGLQQGSKPWLSTQNVMGTFGYIPPEAGFSLVATLQADVYSYGVLLLELLTGKEPTNDPCYGEALHVVTWVKEIVQLNEGKMSESVLDPSVLQSKDSAIIEEMLQLEEIALLCTKNNPADRPTMRDVENRFKTLLTTVGKRDGV